LILAIDGDPPNVQTAYNRQGVLAASRHRRGSGRLQYCVTTLNSGKPLVDPIAALGTNIDNPNRLPAFRPIAIVDPSSGTGPASTTALLPLSNHCPLRRTGETDIPWSTSETG